MKTIYFIRHAKSSWNDPTLSDFQRVLNERGERDVVTMGKRLKKSNIMPDLVISSLATRAKITAQSICKEVGFDKDIIFTKDLYESSYERYLNIIHSIDDSINSVFIFAHNPTITEVAESLGDVMVGNMPTCSILCLRFDVDSFSKISPKSGKVLFFDFPKNGDEISYV